MDRVKRIWYLSPMRAAKVQASLRICAVSPEPSLLAHTSSESRGTFRQKARSLAPLNDWACAVKICHDGMLEDTNSLERPKCVCQWNCFTQISTSTLYFHYNTSIPVSYFYFFLLLKSFGTHRQEQKYCRPRSVWFAIRIPSTFLGCIVVCKNHLVKRSRFVNLPNRPCKIPKNSKSLNKRHISLFCMLNISTFINRTYFLC